MAFLEIQFPPAISHGSSGGPGHNTGIVELDAPFEERNQRWGEARRRWDIQYGVRTPTQMAEVLDFAIVMQGAAHGFRFKDWDDFSTAANHFGAHSPIDQIIGAGDGTTTQFQLVTTYTKGGTTRTRRVEKPVTGTVRVALNGVEQTLGTHFSVNTATGVVTFNVAPTAGVVVSAGCQFDVPVRFDKPLDELLEISLDADELRSSASIPIIELKNEVPVNDEFHPRGSMTVNPMGVDITLAGNDPILIMLNPTANNRVVNLPNPTSLQAGAPWFDLFNLHATNNILIKDHTGATIGTLAGLQKAEAVLAIDAALTKKWFVA